MSRDAIDSIYLWAGAVAVFGLFWAALHFQVVPPGPHWVQWIVGLLGAVNLGRFLFGLWQCRASKGESRKTD
jgi:hypothetical protein